MTAADSLFATMTEPLHHRGAQVASPDDVLAPFIMRFALALCPLHRVGYAMFGARLLGSPAPVSQPVAAIGLAWREAEARHASRAHSHVHHRDPNGSLLTGTHRVTLGILYTRSMPHGPFEACVERKG